MLNANNTYFENLKKIGHDWEAARAERQARKQPIIDTYGWESEELKAWYAEDAAAKFPFESGVSKAYRAWAQSLSRKEDEVEMDDFLWEKEVTDFIETLRKAGIETFVYTNQSTAVMENLHQFAAAGCTMQGLCTITRQESRWLHDAGPLHHHPAGEPLGRRRALRGDGHPLFPELKPAGSPSRTTEPEGSVGRICAPKVPPILCAHYAQI